MAFFVLAQTHAFARPSLRRSAVRQRLAALWKAVPAFVLSALILSLPAPSATAGTNGAGLPNEAAIAASRIGPAHRAAVSSDQCYASRGAPMACDGDDPAASGCSADAYTVTNAWGWSGGVRLHVELRWSPHCQTNWSRVTSGPWTYLEALAQYRDGSWGRGTEHFQFTNYIWSGMIVGAPGYQCVAAAGIVQAWIVTGCY
jgi:hypothetical protein